MPHASAHSGLLRNIGLDQAMGQVDCPSWVSRRTIKVSHHWATTAGSETFLTDGNTDLKGRWEDLSSFLGLSGHLHHSWSLAASLSMEHDAQSSEWNLFQLRTKTSTGGRSFSGWWVSGPQQSFSLSSSSTKPCLHSCFVNLEVSVQGGRFFHSSFMVES